MHSDAVTRRILSDILHHIVLIKHFVEKIDYEEFRSDLRTVYAVIRCLEIISEVSRRLPDSLKIRHPSIEWKQMAAAGNVYRHEYEDISARFVWATNSTRLAPLKEAIERELANES